MLCNETWNTTNNPKNSCRSSGSQHQEFYIPGTILITKETNIVYCELHKCFAPPPLNQAPFLFCIHSRLAYCGRPRCSPNICHLLFLSYVALGDRTGGRPTDALCAPRVSGAQQNGCPRQLADPTAQGSQGPPGQPAGLQQAQALPQEQQVAMPETNPHPHFQSPALQQSRKKARKKTRWVVQKLPKTNLQFFQILL